MKRMIIAVVIGLILFSSASASAATGMDRAWCEEYFSWWWKYDGHVQFVPSYTATREDNYKYQLVEGRKVNQAYVNFTREKKGEPQSIVGGRQWTRLATDRNSNSVYSVTVTASDSLNIFTNKTRFWYGWRYFD